MRRLSLLPLALAAVSVSAQTGQITITVSLGGVLPTAVAPVASPSAGAVASGTVVTLSSTTPGSIIRYSTSGTVSCLTGTIGTSVTITGATTISAINCPVGYVASPVLTAAYTVTAPPSSLYPTSAPYTAMSLGANGSMNGFLPGCPTSDNCSIIYKDISADPIDSVADAAFRAWYNGSQHLAPNFEDANTTLPWYTIDSSTDTGITYRAFTSTDIQTQSDDTVLPLKCGSMYTEGGGDPCAAWTGDGRDRHLTIIDRNSAAATVNALDLYQPETKNGVGQVYSTTAWNLLQPYEKQTTQGYTSSDAAGLLPSQMGVTYDDLAAGDIKHVLRGTVPQTSCAFYNQGTKGLYQSPASHQACGGGGPYKAYLGEWLRVDANLAVPTGCSGQGLVVFNALKKHGWMVTDNGLFGLLQGTYDSRIDQQSINTCISGIGVANMHVIKVNNAPLLAGELNPEDLTAGVSTVWNQNGKTKANATDGTVASCQADAACGQGVAVTNNPAPPTASCTLSANTVALGSSVTANITATNSTKAWLNNAYGIVTGATGGQINFAPTQTMTYTAKVRGLNGYAYASCGTVTVTGPTVATPTYTPAPGDFTSAQSVTIADSTSGSAIYYTRDGSTPTTSSTPYTAPVSISTPTTLKAIATKSGLINSQIASGFYNVQIAGATPATLNKSSAPTYDGSPQSVSANFTSGSSAAIGVMWTGTASVPTSVTCGTKSATLVISKAAVSSSAPSVAFYFIQSVDGGAQTCTVTNAASNGVYIVAQEVSGTSGVDVSSSGNTQVGSASRISCGSVTTTGTNRLALVWGGNIYSTGSASPGYSLLFAAGTGYALASLPVASASTVALTVDNPYQDTASCVGITLKP